MSDIQLNVSNAIATVTLNRPDVHNAFNDEVIASLIACFEQIQQDDKIRVMILQSKGKSFSAGADINWMQKMASYTQAQNEADAKQLAKMLYLLYHMNIPTIAKIQGSAYGGALGLIACCDIAIASRLSKFYFSEVKLGLIPATISPYVIQAVGPRQAKRLFMTAEVISARRARRIGLISEAVSEDSLDDAVLQIAHHLLQNGPRAVSLAKNLVDQVSNKTINSELIDNTSQQIAAVRVSPEGQEGLRAFLDKRPANWIK